MNKKKLQNLEMVCLLLMLISSTISLVLAIWEIWNEWRSSDNEEGYDVNCGGLQPEPLLDEDYS